jgi:phosphoglycolate phosphatase
MQNRNQSQTSHEIQSKEVILFDLDGTLTDPKAGITKSVAYALDSFGIKTDDLDDLCCFIGPPLKDSFMKFHAFNEVDAIVAIEKYREYFKDTGLFENELYDGIDSMLQRLSAAGRELIVATSKPKIFADRILEHFNIAQYFTLVCGSELDGTRTKKSEVIQYALEKAGITDLSKAIMVGDREHDVIGANEVGIDCIGVLYGYGCREEFEKAGAALIVESVEELGKALL